MVDLLNQLDCVAVWECRSSKRPVRLLAVWECRSSTGLPPPPVMSLGLMGSEQHIAIICERLQWLELWQEVWSLAERTYRGRWSGITSGSLTQWDIANRRSQFQECGCIPRAYRCPPRQEANGWPTGPTRLYSGVRMQELHSLLIF
jgi:hypothetical protein